MKISIVTATIQADDALRLSLDSVATQTHRDIEHIVVDGSGSDAVRRLCAGYPMVRVISRARHGVYDAINAGLQASTGDIVGIVHGSDRLAAPDIIGSVARAFDADPQLDFIYGDLRYVRPGTYSPLSIYRSSDFRPRHLIYGMTPPHPTLYMRRRTMQRVGPYTTRYTICGDTDMWVRLFSDTSLHHRHLPLVMVEMPTGGLSTTWRARLYTNNHEKLQVLRSHNLPASPLRLLGKYLMVLRYRIRAIFR